MVQGELLRVRDMLDEVRGEHVDAGRRDFTPPVIASGSLGGSPQPVLPVTGGLLLRPWEEADAPAFLSAYQDDEIRRWHTRRPSAEDQVREWFEAYRQDWRQEKGGHWVITRDDGAEVLGRLPLRGLGALTAWALAEIGFHRLELDHSTRNHASCRGAAKSGYLLEGTKRSAAVHDDCRGRAMRGAPPPAR